MSESRESRRRLPRPTYANITATLALIAACSGTAVAVAPQLADRSVSARAIQPEAVRASHVAPGSIRNVHIDRNAIDGSKIRGMVMRLRGPLPVGVQAQGRVQAEGASGLARIRVVGPSATPQVYPGFPGGYSDCFANTCPDRTAHMATRATAQASCPAGTVLLSSAVAVSGGSGTAPGSYTPGYAGARTYTGTWTVTPSAASSNIDPDSETATAVGNFSGVFASPPNGGMGSFSGSPRQPDGYASSAREIAAAVPPVSAPAGPIAGVGVQAVAYCLALVNAAG
jgi:hypothetical protein